MITKWAYRELRNNLRFSLFFVFNLTLGLTGFLCLDAFKSSLDDTLRQNSKSFLSADYSVSARRRLTEAEVKNIHEVAPKGTEESRLWEFFSMVVANEGSRLVQIKAIDDNYPFYGYLTLGSGQKINYESNTVLNKERLAWVYPELLAQLKIKVGDEISLGNQKYKIADTIVDDSTQTFRLASLAPKVYVGLEMMKDSSLITMGTTMTEAYLFRLPNDQELPAVIDALKVKITDPAVRFNTPTEASEDTGRVLNYLSDYLGLVSLVALFLAALGSAYLYRSYIFSKFKSVAIFNSLGLTKKEAQRIYILQLVMLGALSSVLSLVAGYLTLPVLKELLLQVAPLEIPLHLSGKTILLAFAMGTLGSLFICFPFLKPMERLNTSQLLLEDSEIAHQSRWQDYLLFLPAAFAYYGLALWQAKSLTVGSLFISIFVGSLFVLLAVGYVLIWALSNLKTTKPWYLRHAFLSLSRRKVSSLAVVVALGLGSLLINILPQLKVSLQAELESPKNVKLPSLFLFDIQDEQLQPLKDLLQAESVPLNNVSPMIRARILKVNDRNYERAIDDQSFKTREEETEARFRNRGVNLSYREGLADSETLLEGKPFSGIFDEASGKPVELSVEGRFADRMGLNLHDKITFDVQGVELLGQIVNLRSVKWNSFQPNFFIMLQPGALDAAPKTWLAAIPKISEQKVEELQNKVIKILPNVSIIDVARTVKRIFEVSEQMSWSLELMAALALVAGFVVLYSMANHQVRARRWDLNMMKILGSGPAKTQKFLLYEFGLLGFIAGFFGMVLSLLVSFIISVVLFEGTYSFELLSPILALIAITAVSLLVAYFASRSVVREKPLAILQSTDDD